jgi:hypothetical protein
MIRYVEKALQDLMVIQIEGDPEATCEQRYSSSSVQGLQDDGHPVIHPCEQAATMSLVQTL